MTTRTRILTGITTTGTPHLGNYAGAIRPAILASQDANADSFYFLADYHALIKCDDPQRIQRSRMEIAATWLAGGLDVNRVTFYRQSDIPEIPELTWLLTCVAAKGLLNRAHAYKASVDKNVETGEDPDAGITMGLYSYPVLMAADILMFNAHKVPVGRDQIQHVEMARDIGQRFNHLFGNGKEFFTMPEALIEESVATLPGLDGRKMSKSYDNTIPLFTSAKDMKDAISRIVTDSRAPGEAKDPDNSHLFTLYQAFASKAQEEEFRAELLQLQPVVAHKQGQGVHLALAALQFNLQLQALLRAQQRGQRGPDGHPLAAPEAVLPDFAVLEQVGVQAHAGVDQKQVFVDGRHLHRLGPGGEEAATPQAAHDRHLLRAVARGHRRQAACARNLPNAGA